MYVRLNGTALTELPHIELEKKMQEEREWTQEEVDADMGADECRREKEA